MKVILLQNVAGLGKTDEVKDVKDGFALNFLFPRHLAVLASGASLLVLSDQKGKKAREEEHDLKENQKLATRLDGLELKFVVKANEGGVLYSAVGAQKISEKLSELGFKISKEQITVESIKSAGEFHAKIKLRHGLEADVSIFISIAT